MLLLPRTSSINQLCESFPWSSLRLSAAFKVRMASGCHLGSKLPSSDSPNEALSFSFLFFFNARCVPELEQPSHPSQQENAKSENNKQLALINHLSECLLMKHFSIYTWAEWHKQFPSHRGYHAHTRREINAVKSDRLQSSIYSYQIRHN